MDVRRSYYFVPRQDDFAEPALDSGRLNCDDIPFIRPANDNFPIKKRLSWREILLRLLMLGLFG
jgi:hypothetical protein